MRKKICLVEQGKHVNWDITLQKKKIWETEECDYVRFNWYTDDDPNATYTLKDLGGVRCRWSEGRNLLFSKTVDKYDYILYTDEDTIFSHIDGKNPHDELISFIDEWNPIALNIYHYFLPQIMIWCKKSANTTSTTSLKTEGPRIPEESVLNNNEPTTHFTGSLGVRRKRRWEEQNSLLPENPLSYDYIEMVIQEN